MKLEIKNLTCFYGNKEVLHDINIKISNGEFVSILGKNGAGKSTLFKCVLKHIKDYTGEILVDGINTTELNASKLSSYIAYIPQNASPVYNYSVKDIVLMGTTAGYGFFRTPGEAEEQRALDALDKLGILAYRDRCFHHLSGGEKQLVLIARALAQNANILLFDEPTSALDFGNQVLVLNQMKILSKEGFTVIQTTHNPEQAYLFSDKIVALKDGTVLKFGTAAEIIEKGTLMELYGWNLDVESLKDDKYRICIPNTDNSYSSLLA